MWVVHVSNLPAENVLPAPVNSTTLQSSSVAMVLKHSTISLKEDKIKNCSSFKIVVSLLLIMFENYTYNYGS